MERISTDAGDNERKVELARDSISAYASIPALASRIELAMTLSQERNKSRTFGYLTHSSSPINCGELQGSV